MARIWAIGATLVQGRFEDALRLLYKTKPMKQAVCLLVLALWLSAQLVAQEPSHTPEAAAISNRLAGLDKHAGFLTYYWDEKKGEVLFELSPDSLSREFLYFTSMGSGIGSTTVFADRSSFAGSKVCRFQRAGTRVLVIQENMGFRAETGSAELKRSVSASFPTSVLAALPIEAEQGGWLVVNANPLLIRDAADLTSQLRRPMHNVAGRLVREQASGANWHLDESRSVADLDSSGSFPLNTEMEALLTFASDAEGDFNQPEPHTLSVREHHSFVALPAPGYEVREQDPRVGFFGVTFLDFSQPFNRPLNRYLVSRWRLQKKDPNAAVSEPVKPIVFYLDRAIPEPERSAARRGALWWNQAFEQAGFKNAFRIEDLPEGASPLDMRYPTIQWTNRSGRGWSVGMTHTDPRTGEIIHAVVQLDSHRMRTANNYWESVMPPAGQAEPALDSFAALDGADPEVSDEQVMLNRIALLTCHEVGHTLGLDHNFIASTFGRGSVMDYFAPRVHIRSDGSPDLSDAYMQGTGSYDRFAIEWGYSQGKPGAAKDQERARLDGIVKGAISKGITWGNYDDPRWNAYDDGPDPVTWLKEVLPVRDVLLTHYGPQMLRPGEPSSMLASRFPLIYLFHRYALAAAINVIGGAKVPLTLAGDGQSPVNLWPADSQKAALQMVLQSLTPSKLEVPPALWKQLAPVENRDSDPEAFHSSAGYLFSPQDGARAVAEIVVGGLLDPERMQRLAVLSHEDAGQLSPSMVITALINEGFSAGSFSPAAQDLAGVVQTEITEQLMILAVDADATPEVQAAALAGIRDVQREIKDRQPQSLTLQRLDHNITLFLLDPRQNMPKPKAAGAPPGPPV